MKCRNTSNTLFLYKSHESCPGPHTADEFFIIDNNLRSKSGDPSLVPPPPTPSGTKGHVISDYISLKGIYIMIRIIIYDDQKGLTRLLYLV